MTVGKVAAALIPTVTVSLPVDALRRSYEAVVQEGPAE